ncbi:aspartic proteinase protein [Trifolium repens]|nr:aspartic proteinase protein [Trifolium repens]
MAVGILLWLLLAKGLVLETAIAVTFSSRIIHRFSDEAKVHLASRNNGGAKVQSWPKRNSSEYFRLLLNSDMNRQKMKLGSQYESFYPYEGSQTFFFGNDLEWLHYTWIDIGTPNVSFLVALDTGSDLLWVPCDCIECAPLSAAHYNVLDRDLNQYSSSLSSTSRHLPCSHQLCNQNSSCKGSKDPCPYIGKYASDDTSSSGFLIEDKLHLVSNNATKNSVQASVIFGCGRKQGGDFLEGAAPDGLLGLGTGSISVPSLLAKAGLIRNSFSICLNDNGSGRILFGNQGHVTQQRYTPFLPVNGKFVSYFVGVERFCVGSFCLKETEVEALIDTGTSFTLLPKGVYDKVVVEFDKQVHATRINSQSYPFEYCYNASSQESFNIPPMKITFSKNQSFIIQNPIVSISQEDTAVCLAVLQYGDDYVTIGQNFLMGYHMVFDRENLRFGWSRSNCQDSMGDTSNVTSPSKGGLPGSIPANQQQRTPNSTHAVPPAVAGKTSPKPSAATSGLHSRHLLNSYSLICLLLFWLFG